MRSLRLVLVLLSFVLVSSLAARAASAQGTRAGGIGLGAETMVAGAVGDPNGPGITTAAFVFDRPAWHIAGLVGMSSAGDTDLFVGGRFFYHLHQGAMSDFSIGGGLGILSLGDDAGPGDDDRTDIIAEVATQIRAFITSNVAIGASIGLGFVVVDEDQGDDYLVLGGQVMSRAGIWYFFQ